MRHFDLYHGDCLDRLKALPDNCIDSICTDPPYGLSFMGKKWDYDVPSQAIWEECLRVLKPGGYLLAFAGTRTQHRMAVRIEDAGFEIRDMIAWVYGSGMPKHKSGLKPALEPITLARKPASRATLLNIDVCRVGDEGGCRTEGNDVRTESQPGAIGAYKSSPKVPGLGRYPANLIHDGSEEVVSLFPDSNGAGKSLPRVKVTGYGDKNTGTGKAEYHGGERIPFESGSGSAARFFYCAKCSSADRNAGLSEDQLNKHPTLKPTALMRYLCRLVTPPGGKILDPFMGSGSTGKAAMLEGFDFVGCEMDEDSFNTAQRRIRHAQEHYMCYSDDGKLSKKIEPKVETLEAFMS